MKHTYYNIALSIHLFLFAIGIYILSQEYYALGLINIILNAILIPNAVRGIKTDD